MVLFLLSAGCGPSPAEHALEAAAPAEFAGWRAARAASEAARRNVEPTLLEACRQAQEELAAAKRMGQDLDALTNALKAARGFLYAMRYLENPPFDRRWEIREQVAQFSDATRSLYAELDALEQKSDLYEPADLLAIRDLLEPPPEVSDSSGPEAQARAEKAVDTLEAMVDAGLLEFESLIAGDAPVWAALSATETDAVLALEAAEEAGREALARLMLAAPAAWTAFEAAARADSGQK